MVKYIDAFAVPLIFRLNKLLSLLDGRLLEQWLVATMSPPANLVNNCESPRSVAYWRIILSKANVAATRLYFTACVRSCSQKKNFSLEKR